MRKSLKLFSLSYVKNLETFCYGKWKLKMCSQILSEMSYLGTLFLDFPRMKIYVFCLRICLWYSLHVIVRAGTSDYSEAGSE